MATSFEDLSREVGESHAVSVQVLAVAQQAVDAIKDLQTKLASGGLTAQEAADLAASLDADQQALAAKLAEVVAAIQPTANASIASSAGDVGVA